MKIKSTKIVLTPATWFNCWIIPNSTTKTWGRNTVICFWPVTFNHPGLCQHGCCKHRKPPFKRRTHYKWFSFCPPPPFPQPPSNKWEWRTRWSAEMALLIKVGAAASYSAHIRSSISITDDRRNTHIDKYELNLPGFKCTIF